MPRTLALIVALLSFARPATATESVSTCGQVVSAHKTGVLAGDLSCASGNGVVLADGAKLKLDGHVLSGSADASNVVCSGTRRCTITGPGEIVGGYAAVTATNIAGLKITDVTVRDQLRSGIDGLAAVNLKHVIMTNIGFGPDSPAGSTEIIRTGKLDATDLNAHDNNGSVSAAKYAVRRSVIVNNAGVGIGGPGKGKLIKSTVTGNQGGPSLPPVDILGTQAPKLIQTVCDHSYDANTGGTLGICQLD